MSKIFEYAVLYHPPEKRDAQNNVIKQKSTIIVDVTRTLADSDKEVAFAAARAIPEDYADRLDQVEVLVRPF